MSVMQEDAPSPGRTRRRFTKEFKADAVALVLDGDGSIASVARIWGSRRRIWGTGFAKPASIAARSRG